MRTPEPWEWSTNHRVLFHRHPPEFPDKSFGELILRDQGGTESILVHGATWDINEENASLIASAPALFDALKVLVEWGLGLTMQGQTIEDLPDHPVNVARAAIAQAEGND